MAAPPQELVEATMKALEPYKADFPNEEKHFKRPPIKFLSLIIGALHKHTGFGEGVFTTPEITGGLATKDDKLNFFQKLKEYTQILVGHPIDVEPKQIAAGKDVEKTLVFMQAFAQGAKSPKVSFAAAAAKLNGGAAPAPAPAPAPAAAPAPTPAPAADDSAEKAKKEKEEKEKAEREKQEKRERMLKAKAEKERQEKEKARKEQEERERQEKARKEQEERERQEKQRKEPVEEQIEDETSNAGPAVNARKAPPRIRDAKNVVMEAAVPEIIKEGEDESVDDVFDEEDSHMRGMNGIGGMGVNEENKEGNNEKGKFLQIISKSRQMAEQGKGNMSNTSDSESYKAGICIAKDLLQLLARSAQPLDTLIQFSQEDLGNMKNEYKRWTEECERQEKALAKEKAITDQVLGEQMAKIENLEKEITRQQTKLRSIKATAFLKEADMMKAFTSMCTQ